MTDYDTFVARFHSHFTRDANACVFLGVDKLLDELPDPSLTVIDSQISEAVELIEQLSTLDLKHLSFDESLDLELAELALRKEVLHATYRFNDRTQLEQMPTAGDDIGEGIFVMLANDPRATEDRLDNITSRLERVPDYLNALLERLDHPLERWVNMDLESVQSLPMLFASVESLAHEVRWSDLRRLELARTSAEKALKNYWQQLARLATTSHLFTNVDTARQIVLLNGIDLSLEELHVLARDFLRTTNDALEELRGRLVTRYGLDPKTSSDNLHEFLTRKFRLPFKESEVGRIVDRYTEELARVVAFIQQKDLFPIPHDQSIEIVPSPKFMVPTVPMGAMMSPPPFRAGKQRSLVYLTLSPELLEHHTLLDIPGMVIHEGIPGHHLQLAMASMQDSVIRRHFDAKDQGEGWATMLEGYMLDIGYMEELRDEVRFVAKRSIRRLAARVAIDLFFMTGDHEFLELSVPCDTSSDDPFIAAGNLLKAVAGFPSHYVDSELNWYSQQRGDPLLYLAGNHLVWNLKRDFFRASQERDGLAADREFHRVFLEAGNMPIRFLRKLFKHNGALG